VEEEEEEEEEWEGSSDMLRRSEEREDGKGFLIWRLDERSLSRAEFDDCLTRLFFSFFGAFKSEFVRLFPESEDFSSDGFSDCVFSTCLGFS
jgi:hypothetical protein